jgi:hypothetical protein
MGAEEKVIGYFDAAKIWPIGLFFTTDRIIGAKTARLSMLLISGFHYVRDGARRTEELGQLSPDAILTSDEKSFIIPYSEILRIHVKKPGVFMPGKVVVETTQGVQKFSIPNLGIFNQHDFHFEFLENPPDPIMGKITIDE